MSNVSIVIQSFAIFVALSTMLGRIYFLTYMDVLGVPHTDVRLNVTDYALLSPDVTVFGIGAALFYGTAFLFQRQLNTTSLLPIYSKFKIGLVLVLALVSFVGLSSSPIAPYILIFPGLFGLIVLLYLIINLFLWFMFWNLAFSNAADDNRSQNPEDGAGIRQRQVRTLALITLLVLSVVVIIILNTSAMARSKARVQLETAPIAKVEFDQTATSQSNEEADVSCSMQEMCSHFRVVLLSEKFVYLLPHSCDTCPEGETHLYAVPVNDIVALSFIKDSSRN